MEKKDFAHAVRRRRLALNMNQTNMAAALSTHLGEYVSVHAYRRWEWGHALPREKWDTEKILTAIDTIGRSKREQDRSWYGWNLTLRRLREKSRTTQEEMARRLGVAPLAYHRWEAGLSVPREGVEVIVERARRALGGRTPPGRFRRELLRVRAIARMTRRELAQAVGVPVTTLAGWERGDKVPYNNETIQRTLRRAWLAAGFGPSGVPYRDALPREKWDTVERFLGFSTWAAAAYRRRGLAPDMTAILSVWRAQGLEGAEYDTDTVVAGGLSGDLADPAGQ